MKGKRSSHVQLVALGIGVLGCRIHRWIGGGDTQAQVRMSFPTKEEAIAYAERNGIPFDLEIPRERRLRTKAYADNFSYHRLENWTH